MRRNRLRTHLFTVKLLRKEKEEEIIQKEKEKVLQEKRKIKKDRKRKKILDLKSGIDSTSGDIDENGENYDLDNNDSELREFTFSANNEISIEREKFRENLETVKMMKEENTQRLNEKRILEIMKMEHEDVHSFIREISDIREIEETEKKKLLLMDLYKPFISVNGENVKTPLLEHNRNLSRTVSANNMGTYEECTYARPFSTGGRGDFPTQSKRTTPGNLYNLNSKNVFGGTLNCEVLFDLEKSNPAYDKPKTADNQNKSVLNRDNCADERGGGGGKEVEKRVVKNEKWDKFVTNSKLINDGLINIIKTSNSTNSNYEENVANFELHHKSKEIEFVRFPAILSSSMSMSSRISSPPHPPSSPPQIVTFDNSLDNCINNSSPPKRNTLSAPTISSYSHTNLNSNYERSLSPPFDKKMSRNNRDKNEKSEKFNPSLSTRKTFSKSENFEDENSNEIAFWNNKKLQNVSFDKMSRTLDCDSRNIGGERNSIRALKNGRNVSIGEKGEEVCGGDGSNSNNDDKNHYGDYSGNYDVTNDNNETNNIINKSLSNATIKSFEDEELYRFEIMKKCDIISKSGTGNVQVINERNNDIFKNKNSTISVRNLKNEKSYDLPTNISKILREEMADRIDLITQKSKHDLLNTRRFLSLASLSSIKKENTIDNHINPHTKKIEKERIGKERQNKQREKDKSRVNSKINCSPQTEFVESPLTRNSDCDSTNLGDEFCLFQFFCF